MPRGRDTRDYQVHSHVNLVVEDSTADDELCECQHMWSSPNFMRRHEVRVGSETRRPQSVTT